MLPSSSCWQTRSNVTFSDVNKQCTLTQYLGWSSKTALQNYTLSVLKSISDKTLGMSNVWLADGDGSRIWLRNRIQVLQHRTLSSSSTYDLIVVKPMFLMFTSYLLYVSESTALKSWRGSIHYISVHTRVKCSYITFT